VLNGFLKMLVLALLQIHIPVFHAWKSIELGSAWVGNYRTDHF